MANYEVPPGLLEKFLPHKTEIDYFNNICYVSLVGFMFLDVKVKGIGIPFHKNFEEVNLRFYVKHKDKNKNEWKRGVVFLKEIVPKAAIVFVANTIYGENYETMEMSHEWNTEDNRIGVKYSWEKDGWNSIKVIAGANGKKISKGSEAEFITEHYWGYTRLGKDKTSEYGVEHPRWDMYEVNEYEINTDFGKIYGEEFALLNNQKPLSVFLAEGSDIRVMEGGKI